jgi:hypothetical protein
VLSPEIGRNRKAVPDGNLRVFRELLIKEGEREKGGEREKRGGEKRKKKGEKSLYP